MAPRLPTSSPRSGLATGDLLIGLALTGVVLALVLPTLGARSLRASVDDLVADVEKMRLGAEHHLRNNRSWPTPGVPGAIPRELTDVFADDASLARDRYTMQWTRWEVVDSVEALAPSTMSPPADAPPDSLGPVMLPLVREVGGIVVHTGDPTLLAELLRRYGATSFVSDTMWTLVLPERAGGG
jgi:hypothetical protein